MTARTTQLQVANKTVEVTDECIERLNAVLNDCPLCVEKQVDGRWTHVPDPSQRMQLQPAISIEAITVKK